MNAEVSAVLALTLGEPILSRSLSWTAVWEIARRERCAPLAWIRSSDVIQRNAPADVVTRWRAEFFAAVALGEFWQELVGDTIEAIEHEATGAVVLKGLPLALRLYGDAAARPCSDLDLYVALPHREAAHNAITRMGWVLRRGEPPFESCYLLTRGARTAALEVHSSLLDDNLLAHLPFEAPGSSRVELGRIGIKWHDDDQLPAFLATHLAKHALPPLLWYVDFLTLWRGMTPDAHARARVASRRSRTHRYLEWAISCASRVEHASRGDSQAIGRLGFQEGERREGHNAVRVARLAASPMDLVRVVVAWAAPTRVRQKPADLFWLLLGRLRSPRRVIGGRRTYRRAANGSASEDSPPRTIKVSAADLSALVGDLPVEGSGFWLRVAGSSMSPAIPSGAMVHLSRPAGSPPPTGAIVLAALNPDTHVLHRVIGYEDGRIQLRGDANLSCDPPIAREQLLAVAGALITGGRERPLARHEPLLSHLRRVGRRSVRVSRGLVRLVFSVVTHRFNATLR